MLVQDEFNCSVRNVERVCVVSSDASVNNIISQSSSCMQCWAPVLVNDRCTSMQAQAARAFRNPPSHTCMQNLPPRGRHSESPPPSVVRRMRCLNSCCSFDIATRARLRAAQLTVTTQDTLSRHTVIEVGQQHPALSFSFLRVHVGVATWARFVRHFRQTDRAARRHTYTTCPCGVVQVSQRHPSTVAVRHHVSPRTTDGVNRCFPVETICAFHIDLPLRLSVCPGHTEVEECV
jgi:hypothetical protein